MKHILAFFGAFNPPTLAHINLAEYAYKYTKRDGVVFVPSKSRYISDEQGKSFAYTDNERFEMLTKISSSRPWMKVTDIELKEQQQPRTYHTLCRLRELGYEPSLLLGSDKLPELENMWRYVPEILQEFGLVCMNRTGDDSEVIIKSCQFLLEYRQFITVVPTPLETQHISSTEVRENVLAYKSGAITRVEFDERTKGVIPEEILQLL